jgi:hypothetical protein
VFGSDFEFAIGFAEWAKRQTLRAYIAGRLPIERDRGIFRVGLEIATAIAIRYQHYQRIRRARRPGRLWRRLVGHLKLKTGRTATARQLYRMRTLAEMI